MVQLDLEDMNFLKDLAEELWKHKGVYDPEAGELENIIIRAESENKQNIQTVKFVCSKCGNNEWFRIDLVTYIVSANDLLCESCNPITEKDE